MQQPTRPLPPPPLACRRIDEAARNHKRYMHYFERFKQHSDSHTKEKAKRCVGGVRSGCFRDAHPGRRRPSGANGEQGAQLCYGPHICSSCLMLLP